MLREQKLLVIFCILATAFAATAYTATQKNKYQATAKLLLQQDNLSGALAGTGIGFQDPTRQAATDAQLVSLPAVAARVTKKVKKPLSAAAVSTSAGGDSNVLSVNVIDRDPKLAATFANAFAREYIAFRRDNNRARVKDALSTVKSQLSQLPKRSPRRAVLHGQIRQLQLLSSLQNGDATLIQPALAPRSPISPSPARNIGIGVIVGLVLGFGLAILRDRLDRRVKKEEQLEGIFPDVPVIASVPEVRRRKETKLLAGEAFHMLQANLRFLGSNGSLRTLLVTSAGTGEGKSTVALNLALALRELDKPTLVIDADLRRPALSERVLADPRHGLPRIVSGDESMQASVQECAVNLTMNGRGPRVALEGTIPIVPAGPPQPNPQVILNERSIGTLLEQAGNLAETVIVDGPPIGAFSDMVPVARAADGVIVAVRLYHSREDELKRLNRELANASIKPLGIVVLGAPLRTTHYRAYYPQG